MSHDHESHEAESHEAEEHSHSHAHDHAAEVAAPASVMQRFDLPSGRQVALRMDADREEIVLTGKDGAVELQIVMTDEGPVLRMPVARVSLRGAEQLDLCADRVRIRAKDDVSIEAGGRLDLRSEDATVLTSNDDMRIVGEMIYLN